VTRRYLLQFILHIASDIGFLLGRSFFCRCDRELVPIDSNDALKFIEQCLGEEPCTAVSVDQEVLIRWNKTNNQIAQYICNLIIGLRENTRTSGRPQGVMSIARISLPELCQRLVYFVARDRATLDVNQPM